MMENLENSGSAMFSSCRLKAVGVGATGSCTDVGLSRAGGGEYKGCAKQIYLCIFCL